MGTTTTTAADIVHGNCLTVMADMPADSIDSIVTDGPYGLAELPADKVVAAITQWVTGDRAFVPDGRGFMTADWDSFVPPPAVWDQCFRLLKPGAHLLAFAGARTADLMGLAIRLAGFEIRDTIHWAYGSAMPHGIDAAKALDARFGHTPGDAPASPEAQQWAGWHTGLKPAVEPIIVARKPMIGPVADNLLAHGVGALNIDGCRIPVHGERAWADTVDNGVRNGIYNRNRSTGSTTADPVTLGRFPANLVLTHSPACQPTGRRTQVGPAGEHIEQWACHPGCPVPHLDQQSEDHGSRFFHHTTWTGDDLSAALLYVSKAGGHERPTGDNGIRHISVKPVALMRHLTRLVTPPNGVILDPFTGSGSTIEAALIEGFQPVGIERHQPYLALIAERIARWQRAHDQMIDPNHDAYYQTPSTLPAAPAIDGQLDMFHP